MSGNKKLFNHKKNQVKNKLIKIIHSQNSTKNLSTTDKKNESTKLLDREFLVALLFLLGSILFLCDGLIELYEGISIHAFLHLPASLMFVIGSFLFMPTDNNN